jgi:hypothetical protein
VKGNFMLDQKTPWHIWVVGGLSLLWNASGAFDYLMAKLEVAAYIEMLSAGEQAYFMSFPLWVNMSWAVAVWASVAGSILVLMRSKYSVAAFAISLIAMLLNMLYGLVLADVKMFEVVESAALAFTAAIVIIAVLLLHYARRMRDRGVLR